MRKEPIPVDRYVVKSDTPSPVGRRVRERHHVVDTKTGETVDSYKSKRAATMDAAHRNGVSANAERIRYAVTCEGADGVRGLASRNLKDTWGEAVLHLSAMVANNTRETLVSAYGERGVQTLAVREVACYANGDPKGVYFDDNVT